MTLISIAVNGENKTLEADYLTPAALEYWHAWIANEARMAHNPFVEFAAKVAALPPALQVVATKEFASLVDFSDVPRLTMLNVASGPRAVELLCALITGEELTPDDSNEAFKTLFPFIVSEEIETDSISQVNALRAQAGKPPIDATPPTA